MRERENMNSEREAKTKWLSRGKPLRMRLIGLRAEHLERLSRADYTSIGRGNGHGRSNQNTTESKYIAIVETEAEMLIAQKELNKIESEVRDAIEQVKNPVYQTYLRMRFLAYQPERQIAAKMGYSFTYVDSHIRKKAIDAVKMPVNDC